MKKNYPEINLNFNSITPCRVLIATLDWGLGHTTRIIPIIQEFLSAGCTVILAGNSKQKAILKTEFPNLVFLHLPGYNVKYGQHPLFLIWKLILQLPRLKSIIKKEHYWLKKMVKENRIQLVISDNRYGLYNKDVHNIFITHQLQIRSSFGRMIDRFIQKLHYRLINKFDECWVPDQLENGLGGELSHPENKPDIPVLYTGWLSRFKEDMSIKKEKHLLIILSGPEPQRTIFETLILNDINSISIPVILLRGLPGHKEIPSLAPHITVYNHLPVIELNLLMQEASFIISRCGYSTVMDIARLKKNSILIPTPGQTEQEYLAKFLSSNNFALCVDEGAFSLEKCLRQAKQFKYILPMENENLLQKIIESTTQLVNSKNTSTKTSFA